MSPLLDLDLDLDIPAPAPVTNVTRTTSPSGQLRLPKGRQPFFRLAPHALLLGPLLIAHAVEELDLVVVEGAELVPDAILFFERGLFGGCARMTRDAGLASAFK